MIESERAICVSDLSVLSLIYEHNVKLPSATIGSLKK